MDLWLQMFCVSVTPYCFSKHNHFAYEQYTSDIMPNMTSNERRIVANLLNSEMTA